MKIAIYHPPLNNFGGGETVALTIASELSKSNQVDIFTPYEVNKKKMEFFFVLDLANVNIVNFARLIEKIPSFQTIKPSFYLRSIYSKLEKYDIVIDTATNGWFDKKLKTKTICYVHFPSFFAKKKGIKSTLNSFVINSEKAFQYDKIVCNSKFTKRQILKYTKKEIKVISPPVQVSSIRSNINKYNRIVTIGRFSREKKHEILIRAFKKLYIEEKKYKLHIIGAFQEKNSMYKQSYVDFLKKEALGYPIEFHFNMPHNKLLNFLEKSKIYWHSRGYGEIDPVEYENFGITTVEAMAAGCVPIVINLGAQPEIVQHGKNGYCWNTPEELVRYTLHHKNVVTQSVESAQKYDKKKFIKKFKMLI